jgi:hypothetical protein
MAVRWYRGGRGSKTERCFAEGYALCTGPFVTIGDKRPVDIANLGRNL